MGSWTLLKCIKYDQRDVKVPTAATLTATSVAQCHSLCESTDSFESGPLGFIFSRFYDTTCICENLLPSSDPASCDGLVPSSSCDGFLCATTAVVPVYTRSPPVLDLPSGWSTSYTCYMDDVNNRVFDGLLGRGFSARTCIVACDKKGNTISAMEAGDFCYCGNGLKYQPPFSTLCGGPGFACWGNSSDDGRLCGGSFALSVFEKIQLALPTTSLALPPVNTVTDGLAIGTTTARQDGRPMDATVTTDAVRPTMTDLALNVVSNGIMITASTAGDMTASNGPLNAQTQSGTIFDGLSTTLSGSAATSSAPAVTTNLSAGTAKVSSPSLSKGPAVSSSAVTHSLNLTSALNTTATATSGLTAGAGTSSEPSKQVIIGAAIGGILAVIVIGLIVFYFLVYRRRLQTKIASGKKMTAPFDFKSLEYTPSDHQAQFYASNQYDQSVSQPQFDQPPAFQYGETDQPLYDGNLSSHPSISEKTLNSGNITINTHSSAMESLDRHTVTTQAPPHYYRYVSAIARGL